MAVGAGFLQSLIIRQIKEYPLLYSEETFWLQ